jgi:uncharacterized protein YndB with AHSA1/START domain
MSEAKLDHSLEVTRTILIRATPATVWHALTDREMIRKYFFGTEALAHAEGGWTMVLDNLKKLLEQG